MSRPGDARRRLAGGVGTSAMTPDAILGSRAAELLEVMSGVGEHSLDDQRRDRPVELAEQGQVERERPGEATTISTERLYDVVLRRPPIGRRSDGRHEERHSSASSQMKYSSWTRSSKPKSCACRF